MKVILRWGFMPSMAGLVLLLFHASTSRPQTVESFYSRGLYPLIRFLLDHTLGLLPFSGLYLLSALLLVLLGRRVYSRLRRRQGVAVQAGGGRFRNVLWAFLQAGSLAVVLGYLLWGFNYHRVPLEQAQGWELAPLSGAELLEELHDQVLALNELREGLQEEAVVVAGVSDLERELRAGYERVLSGLKMPGPWGIRLRSVWPGGLMMSFGVAGMYNPFLGEATIPHALNRWEKPFCAAHELAHACGVAEEGTANFLAFLVCRQASSPDIRYSGHLALFQYLLGECPAEMHGVVAETIQPLSPNVRKDLKEIRDNWRRYTSWLSRVGNRINHLYLKAQGIPEGIRSYNRFLILHQAWKKERAS